MLTPMDDDRAPDGSSPPAERPLEQRDLVLLHSRSETGVRVIRSRAGNLEIGELRAMREGQPISGEVVRLAPTDKESLYEVEVVLEARPERGRSGPAQVATAAYRAQWDAIFGQRDDTLN